MIKTILFDLDGTLLPMDQDHFVECYMRGLARKLVPLGYDKDTFLETMWKGVISMIKNDGSRTNEAAFWDCFTGVFGQKAFDDLPIFDSFYRNEFQSVADECGYTPKAINALIKGRNGGHRWKRKEKEILILR